MNIEAFEKAKPLIGQLARIKKNREELECRLLETEKADKSLTLKISYAGRVETKLLGEDIDTRELMQGIIYELDNQIRDITALIEEI